MGLEYWLPSVVGQKKVYNTEVNSVIIIGANGSGKSKLGAWVEQQNYDKVHRIAAQRSLNFKENIVLSNYELAEDNVFYGSSHEALQRNKHKRWSNEKALTTTLLNDYDDVLSALLAKRNLELEQYVRDCKLAEKAGKYKPHTPETVLDKLEFIWDSIFSHRKLVVEDAKFYTVLDTENGEEKYSATEMSDGERSVLYLVSQVLCVPESKILIIDEPETHLHRSLMNKLWTELEKIRPDCLFIYITHDLEFASGHVASDKIWVRNFDGRNWDIEKIEEDFPEALLLDVLGSRKNVLFVEGEKSSYDTQLYSFLYPNYYVVPCGGCEQVIQRTRAFSRNSSLHSYKVFGIIDRDYRSDCEIESYKKDGIYCISVAEVENLFIVEEILKLAAEAFCSVEDAVEKIKKYVIDRFKSELKSQINNSIINELKHKLSTCDIKGKDSTSIVDCVNGLSDKLKMDALIQEKTNLYTNALNEQDYRNILKIFNQKSLVKYIGKYLGIKESEYCYKILVLMRKDEATFRKAFSQYLPQEVTNEF